MSEYTAVLDEAVWNAWLQRSRVRELRTAYRAKISAAVLMVLVGLGVTSYYLDLFKQVSQR